MDKQTAKKMTAKLLGKTVGGWLVEKMIHYGKSAVVFEASYGQNKGALKIFDPEIVSRYGRDAQLQRIERERSLIGKSHPNLIEVYDGGEQGELLYVVMELFKGKNLEQVLSKIPQTNVRSLISQVAAGAKFLEDVSFAHRDIKPENIGISKDMKSAKLLDFGVLRPLIDLSSITDRGDQRHFIATLQYSPPELLFREEEKSFEAWRAITFYQLGAVLHDLIMRKPLFEKFKNPYGCMVRAVEREIPLIDNAKADGDLRLLAQNCLAKKPSHRLDTVTWEDFSKPKDEDTTDAARRRIAQHRVVALQATENPSSEEDLLNAQLFALRTSISSAIVNLTKTENLPRYTLKPTEAHSSTLLRIQFKPSRKYGLEVYFAVYCQGDVVDPKTNLHQVRVWSCTSSRDGAMPVAPDLTAPCKEIKGALIEQDIRQHIQEYLLSAYADALDMTADGLVRWIDIGRVA